MVFPSFWHIFCCAQGYTYNFVSEANKKTFLKSPSTYVPQFGGFCSYGISSESWCDAMLWHTDTVTSAENLRLWLRSGCLRGRRNTQSTATSPPCLVTRVSCCWGFKVDHGGGREVGTGDQSGRVVGPRRQALPFHVSQKSTLRAQSGHFARLSSDERYDHCKYQKCDLAF
jgi:hypothetical protein